MAENVTAAPWELPFPSSTGKVSLGATDFKELAERLGVILKEKLPVYKSYAGPATLKSGEWADQTKNAEVFTMPAVGTANQYIVTSSSVAEAKLTTAAKFVGGGLSSSTAILTTGMVAVWQSDGTNWRLLAGEVKREQKWSAFTGRESSPKEYEPSATRDAEVMVTGTGLSSIQVGGVSLPYTSSGEKSTATFRVPAGQKWKATGSELKAAELIL
jgi:hypothetical protein